MNKVLNFLRRLHPTKELSKESALWTVVAIILMGFALWVVFTANWQTEGFYKAGYKGGKLVEAIEVFKACRFSIVPHVTSILCAILIYGALLMRRYIRLGNLYALLCFWRMSFSPQHSLNRSFQHNPSAFLECLVGKC